MNQPYDLTRRRFVTAALNWPSLDLRLTALGGIPQFVAADTQISDITSRGTAVLGASLPIITKTVTADGTVQTDAVVIPEVPIGPDVTHFVLIEASGTLILYIDEAYVLPFVPNGLDIVVQPDWIEQRGWFRA